MIKHFDISIYGRVQGVGFRDSAHDVAVELGLTGFVCNRTDGSVYAEVEGNENALSTFVEWCKKGPATASVKTVTTNEGAVQRFARFEIQRTRMT
jgi:acylphosphatase